MSQVTQQCTQCGNLFAQDEMMKFENVWVCAKCKPVFMQKLKEGVKTSGSMTYAGFWIRGGAQFVDGIVLQLANLAVVIPMFGFASLGSGPEATASLVGRMLVGFVIGVAYIVFFLGKFGATPGKMACRLKVVNQDGSPIGYGKAFGRYWGSLLSSITLGIGFMMAGWDSEKRALHDRVCGTRVIRTS